MTTSLFEIIDKPIDVEEVRQKVIDRNAGAITVFIGTVREMTKGKKTLHLEYQAYPAMAIKMFEQISKEIQERWSEAKVAITHRVGHLEISDIAVVIAVSSPHRKIAYEANEYAIDRIKQIVPIWKKEYWEDGTEWIGDQLENVPYPKGNPAISEEESCD
ncbi:molybdenum cofactor biosynthesis protein MoaE [Lysinibacillus xylanilyticus]|uniref:molybdenum cofactor biosynthesis protein MoaE n=1 Tax=Lysinibacillus xylanilyticus TaxID=582475 RepID=UPI002B249028|nr:molybdenum cofactor biosynthesis protein MoaE [Lysinibacillus xylanilyticus]MEB2302418.1 molybdenum cofactor biosynthesis protein MoaE [Lysinibacillus xylanilyticus]